MYELIKTQWFSGRISEKERDELIQFAQEKADVHQSVNVLKKLVELEQRVNSMEKELAGLKIPEGSGDENASETYPEYVAGKWYYANDKISFEGKNYICIAPEGQVCTWNPVEYPAYWILVE